MSINIPVWEEEGGGALDSLGETPVTPFLNPAPTLAAWNPASVAQGLRSRECVGGRRWTQGDDSSDQLTWLDCFFAVITLCTEDE